MANAHENRLSMSGDEEMALQYIRWTEKALDEMESYFSQIEDTDVLSVEDGKRLVKEIYGLSHNIKGTGASFDYILMTDVGASLCNYIKHYPEDSLPEADVLSAHIRSLRVILSYRITGTAGEKGRAVIERLKQLSSQSLGHNATPSLT